MTIRLSVELINALRKINISSLHAPGALLPDNVVFEPPCSIKWMDIQHSMQIGAFSYGVSGYYFACRIGRYCSFGEQVQIGRHPHPMHWFSSSPFFYTPYNVVLDQNPPDNIDINPYKDFMRSTPPVTAKITTIENDVWIGHGAFILPGVKIGTGAVVAAMSVVTKDVQPYSVVAGSPAKIIKYRFDHGIIEKLLTSKWWEYAPWQLKGANVDNIELFLRFVEKLRADGMPTYKPKQIILDDLVKEIIS